MSLCPRPPPPPFFSVLRWTSLRLPLLNPPPPSFRRAGFKCHAWPSERPAGSCLLGEAGEGQRGAEGREALAPIVHYDEQELLTDSKSSASSRHAPSPRPVPALCGAPTSSFGHGTFVPPEAEHANFSQPARNSGSSSSCRYPPAERDGTASQRPF